MEAAKLLLDLEKEDLRILMAIEIGMKRSEYVTVNNIKFYSRYKMEETLFRLKRVHKYDLIIRNSAEYEISYTLNSIGYDILALHSLVEKNIISQLGPLLEKEKNQTYIVVWTIMKIYMRLNCIEWVEQVLKI